MGPAGNRDMAFAAFLLNEARQPVQILQPGERKGIQKQRGYSGIGR